MNLEYLIRSICSIFTVLLLLGGTSKAYDINLSAQVKSQTIPAFSEYIKYSSMYQLEHVTSRSLDAVPMETLENVAEIHAKAIWGTEVARGAPLQLVDRTGDPTLYAFPFAIGDHVFPSADELLERLSSFEEVTANDGEAKSELVSNKNAPIGQYGTIYVSARKRDYPVRRVSHALHPFFYNVNNALMIAAFDSPAKIRLRYIPPYEFFEIQSDDSTIRLHTHTLMSEKEIRQSEIKYKRVTGAGPETRTPVNVYSDKVAAAWNAYDNPTKKTAAPVPRPSPYEFKIWNWRRIAVIDWTLWCEPTAVSMAFSYWDHYVPEPGVGGYPNYPRLVDYWFDHPSNGNNVPDIIDPIADLMNIDVTNILKGYNWKVDKVIGNAINNFAWSELIEHLHINHPVVWQVHGSIHHAVTAFGYRIVNGQKYVALYNTWSANPAAAYDEWLYNDWSSVEVDQYRPGGKELYRNVIVRQPYGGEIFRVGEWNKILFNLHSLTDIEMVRIEYSLDGGRNWSLVVEKLAQPGWNTWWWKPNNTSNRARVRIKGMARDRTYLGGDGSYNNFKIE